MKKRLSAPSLLLTLLLTIVLEYLMSANNVPVLERIIGGLLFFLLNAVILTLLIRALSSLAKVFRLPGVKLYSYAYYLYPVALVILYLTFLAGMGRLARYNVPSYIMAGLIVLGLGLMILAQLGGAFPHRRISSRKRALRVENAGGALGGFEILGSLIGQYSGGIVLGTDPVAYAQMERMHRSKDALIVEGMGDTKLELIIVSEKAQQRLIRLLKDKVRTSSNVLAAAQPLKKQTGMPSKFSKDKPAKRKPVRLIQSRNGHTNDQSSAK